MRRDKKQNNKISGNFWLRCFLFPVLLLTVGCSKFLDEKPRKSDVIPSKLNDLQTLLDNTSIMNASGVMGFAELVADNYYVTASSYTSMIGNPNRFVQIDVQNHIWLADAIPGEPYWINGYRPVYYSNIVLDELQRLKGVDTNSEQYKALRGSALFYRAFAFHSLAQLFCKPFAEENANALGIVLRLTSNAGEVTGRATVQKTYDQIITDLKEAANLLPQTAVILTRPTKTAAYAALARAYLSMRDYENAAQYANMALGLYSTLMNFNSLSVPISTFNPEVIFHNTAVSTRILATNIARIDSTLFRSYDSSDRRQTLFFRENTGVNKGSHVFRGSYNGTYASSGVFDGLATNELYLIRAECAARSGNKDAAIDDLNTLMVTRWSNDGTWVPFTATSADEALNIILTERRKELIWRGLRWSDIRRLNLEGGNLILKRVIASTEYTLPPNDLRTVMLIPLNEITLGGIEQNPR